MIRHKWNPNMADKEKIFDEKIAPLMSEVVKICRDSKIPIYSLIQWDDGGQHYQAKYIPDHTDPIIRFTSEFGDSRNIDRTVFGIIKECKDTNWDHGSIVLNQIEKWLNQKDEN